MKVINSINEMKDIRNSLIMEGKTIGFVPTMGYLHKGHLSLVKQAREDNDIVVVSIFVNPTQFGPNEDFDRYPRDLNRDMELLKEFNVDYIFHPDVMEMYPDGYSTYVEETKLTNVLCGKSRPGHFKGVTTIVSKLFNIVRPTRAYFGQKDAQQFRVLRKMVDDLNMDVKMVEMPIIREEDGLAMSSRNIYLKGEERVQALALYKSLLKAKELFENGERDATKIKEEMKKVFDENPLVKVDYIEIVDEYNLEPVEKIEKRVLVAVAAFVGKARLIDNIILG
ncbi:pantoate--beta-alanine ligase [Marinitoga sp. 1135]|uniref:Pantothenate synthetase n=1 Tax=Marinitoga piezophila (strain DSM 14283 / JCM 11233 / KA3) TaxID=443254 RepID=H2J471_MARPK|nr:MULTISPECIES: pantoate--beta-alanine ligase [Marinitoga]AEX85886.1 pantoate--beta-alanine ligase [Marinitoga piezophila KA3]APT76321.1 pantoate--beta-alanine ligase [Marinitoga sp. 1137]NUU96092.1 pantoate--beta-alanine ligase [Marinitoga sp. 1135]NUU97999.1 pantoate--beta-alanine ligase [Marinitoga sp. 1138]